MTKHALNKWFFLLISCGSLIAISVMAQTSDVPPITATVLLTDISGSMDEIDGQGIVKLAAAQRAAINFLDAVRAEQTTLQGARIDLLSLVTFCDRADEQQGFTEDLAAVRNAITGLATCGKTNMVEGFDLAARSLQGLQNQLAIEQSIIILLSDGLPTTGRTVNDDPSILQADVISQLQAMRPLDVCLYAIPFGDPNAAPSDNSYVDLDFLQQMVNAIGCGSFYQPTDSSQLTQVYIDARIASIGGNVILGQTNVIRQGEQLNLPEIVVQPGQTELRIDTPGQREWSRRC